MRKVIFVTRENASLPGVRVRGHGFAAQLRQSGIAAEVFSYADVLGAACGDQEHTLRLRDKVYYNRRALRRLWPENAIIILQRVHYHSFAPFLMQALRRRPVILDIDDWEAREDCSYRWGWYPRSKAEWLMRMFARYSWCCIGASTFLYEYLKGYHKEVLYIPTGVDSQMFTPAPEQEPEGPVILSWVGTFHRPDNVENIRMLRDIFLRLRKTFKDIRLEIRGDGRFAPEVRTLIADRYGESIRLLPWITAAQMPRYLAGVHIGVVPLFQESKFNNAKSPTRVFEYMSLAKPVVMSDRGEARQIIRQGENGFIAASEDEFEARIASLIRDAALRRAIGRHARETVCQRFSLEKICLPLIEKIRQLP